MAETSDPPQYVAERIRTALAADPHIGELGIAVKIVAGRVHLSGEVCTPDRRAAVEGIVRGLLPDHEVQNDVTVSAVSHAVPPERVR